jgi:hypothetical protein
VQARRERELERGSRAMISVTHPTAHRMIAHRRGRRALESKAFWTETPKACVKSVCVASLGGVVRVGVVREAASPAAVSIVSPGMFSGTLPSSEPLL